MSRYTDITLTAFAPIIWGSSYYVTTEFLPDNYPITAAMLRALPAGLLLLLLVRKLPKGVWWLRMGILGALNFSVFWVCLFIAAYRLPGGVAATLGAIQPLWVIFIAYWILNTRLHTSLIVAALLGMLGVAMLVLGPAIQLDIIGMLAAIIGAAAMAAGTVLTKKWQPPAPLLAFTAWQLIAGGLLLVPIALILEPPLPAITTQHAIGFLWLSLIGAALTYFIWFRGITRLDPRAVSVLGFLSPATAVILGWVLLEQTLTFMQITGVVIVLLSIGASQRLIQKKP